MHPVGTTASSGSSFDHWLDSNYPPTDNHAQEHVARGVPAKGRKGGGGDDDDVDKTGSEHFHRGWYKTHNLHSSLNSGHRGGDRAGDAINGGDGHEEERERERERERENERVEHDREVEHAEREREEHAQMHSHDVQRRHRNPRPSERETHREHAKVRVEKHMDGCFSASPRAGISPRECREFPKPPQNIPKSNLQTPDPES